MPEQANRAYRTSDNRRVTTSAEITPDEPHEVEAFYDNATGQAVGGLYGWPVLYCSCGFRAIAESWEDAGTLYDEHVEEVRSA